MRKPQIAQHESLKEEDLYTGKIYLLLTKSNQWMVGKYLNEKEFKIIITFDDDGERFYGYVDIDDNGQVLYMSIADVNMIYDLMEGVMDRMYLISGAMDAWEEKKSKAATAADIKRKAIKRARLATELADYTSTIASDLADELKQKLEELTILASEAGYAIGRPMEGGYRRGRHRKAHRKSHHRKSYRKSQRKTRRR